MPKMSIGVTEINNSIGRLNTLDIIKTKLNDLDSIFLKSAKC